MNGGTSTATTSKSRRRKRMGAKSYILYKISQAQGMQWLSRQIRHIILWSSRITMRVISAAVWRRSRCLCSLTVANRIVGYLSAWLALKRGPWESQALQWPVNRLHRCILLRWSSVRGGKGERGSRVSVIHTRHGHVNLPGRQGSSFGFHPGKSKGHQTSLAF
jgi:hypothetical protein